MIYFWCFDVFFLPDKTISTHQIVAESPFENYRIQQDKPESSLKF